MAKKYKVYYSGWYIVEADSSAEALETDRDDGLYEEYENTSVSWAKEDSYG